MTKSSGNLDRFWAKVDQSGTCWTWLGCVVVGRGGGKYGQFWADGRAHRAHRWIYGQAIEPLIAGSAVDHLCRNTLCVRPSHLEQVTQRENILRGLAPAAANAAATQCKRGHPLTADNTKIRRDGTRRCATCYAREQAEHNERRRQSA